MDPRLAELAALGVITASLLHELRQPLFGVKATLQLAEDGAAGMDRGTVGELLTMIGHMEELVEHYAGLGRIDDSWTEVDLRDAVLRVASMLGATAGRVGARVVLDLPDGPVYVAGRAVAMRQIALNLVRNALDAVADQPRREVHVRLALANDDTVALVVEDTGPGIPDEVRAELFQPFVTSKPSGTGLGLYIARTLVTEAKGSLAADRLPFGGTSLTVVLPHARGPGPGDDRDGVGLGAHPLQDLQVVPQEHAEQEQ
jgi:two-component system sensor kinase FixL